MKALEYKKVEWLLSKYGIPLCPGRLIFEKKEALAFATKTGYPLVLKVLSPEAVHKTDTGLVRAGIRDKKELSEAWEELTAKKIKKEGILIQKHLSGVEIVIGMKRDPQFGPVLMFGLGGIFVELLKDVSFRIAPVKKNDVKKMVEEIKGHKALFGFRSQKPVDLKKLTGILLSLSELSLREKEIKEVDLNPVIANEKGAWVADPRFLFNMSFKENKLNKIFNPKTLAVIGANPREKSVGWGLLKNAIEGSSKRKIFAVNPNYDKVLNVKCFPSVLSIKEEIDLAVIAVPAKIVPQVVEECCQKKVGGIIIVSSGFAESGKAGKMLEEKIVKMARLANIPLIGPNCLGVIRPDILLNASFAPAFPKPGEIAFFSQSGALVDSVVDESLGKNYGFSVLVSYGNEADITLSDFLRWAEKDEKTKVIALYLEGIKEGREIMNVFSEVSAKKPILVLKAGKTEVGKKAVASHTGSLAGEYRIYQALFKQTGVVEVGTVRELFSSAKALAWQPRCDNGIAIITNGGSCGVLLADYCQELGIKLVKLSRKTLNDLKKSGEMHFAYSKRNPLDIVGDALSGRYRAALEVILDQPDIKGLIVVQTLQIMTETEKNVKIIIEAGRKRKDKPIIATFLGGNITASSVKTLEKNRVPNYDELKDAALAMKSLIKN